MKSNFQISRLSILLDKSGIAFSWICVVHCLALPFLAALLPLIGLSFLVNETAEYVFIGSSILIAVLSLIPAYFKEHGKMRTILLFAVGISLIFFADNLFEENFVGKILFVSAGATLITLSHIFNQRLCSQCRKCRELEKHSLE